MERVLTIGEPMGLFIAKEEKPLECVRNYFTSVAGAEFNVSVGLTRLGIKVGYLTKLGTDPFGKSIINQMNDAANFSANCYTYSQLVARWCVD